MFSQDRTQSIIQRRSHRIQAKAYVQKGQKKIPPWVTVDKESPMLFFWTQPTSTRQELRLRHLFVFCCFG